MIQLILTVALAILVAAITCYNNWKNSNEQDYKRNNRIAVSLFVCAVLAQCSTFFYGYNAINDKTISDSTAAAKDRENKIARDSIITLNYRLTNLALEELDTSKTILKYSQELNTSYQRISALQDQINNYFTGDNVIPWVTTMPGFDRATFTILNPGKNPMWNVKVKCQEQQLPDIGVLPTRVVDRFYTASIPLPVKDSIFEFVIWYNNGKSVIVSVYISRRPDGFLNQDSVMYADRNGIRFEHPLVKHKPKNYWNFKTRGYKPDASY